MVLLVKYLGVVVAEEVLIYRQGYSLAKGGAYPW